VHVSVDAYTVKQFDAEASGLKLKSELHWNINNHLPHGDRTEYVTDNIIVVLRSYYGNNDDQINPSVALKWCNSSTPTSCLVSRYREMSGVNGKNILKVDGKRL
jgi:hypothetical protein